MTTNLRSHLRTLPVLSGPFPPFNPAAFPSTPQSAFEDWLSGAITANAQEPHAMAVSTVDEHGYPDARVLILKDLDDRGWHFAAKADSPKARQIAGNAAVALTFYWPEVARQVRIRGTAVQLSDEECRADFEARPVKSRVSAVASRQSEVLGSREEMLARVGEVESEGLGDGEGGEKWRVYAVEPAVVEFWQGSADRLHWRVRYSVDHDKHKQWVKEMLWP